MFEKIPSSNRWISLESKDLLEGKNQITVQLRNGLSIVLLGNIPCKYDIQNINKTVNGLNPGVISKVGGVWSSGWRSPV